MTDVIYVVSYDGGISTYDTRDAAVVRTLWCMRDFMLDFTRCAPVYVYVVTESGADRDVGLEIEARAFSILQHNGELD
jgi:hypothetical protein